MFRRGVTHIEAVRPPASSAPSVQEISTILLLTRLIGVGSSVDEFIETKFGI